MIWVFCVLILAALAPFLVESQRLRMGQSARKAAPGDIATLSQGKTHYQWYGPEDGPVVLCIHGLTTPSFVWRSIAPALAADGYRVLTYDLYGRGFSDRPRGQQDSLFFLTQINDLLRDQNINGPVMVIGYSMGAAIATALAEQHPQRVRRMALIAPAGIRMSGQDLLRKLVPVPFVGLWAILGLYPPMLRKGIQAEARRLSSVPDIGTLQLAELRWQRFLPSVHASLRDMLSGDQEKAHKALYTANLPMLAIWGGADTVIPLDAKDILAQWNPNIAHHVIEGAGHGITYTDTGHVLGALGPFLSET